MNKPLRVGAAIDIIGEGQLGRTLVMSGKEMSFQIIVLDPTLDSPAGRITNHQVMAAFDRISALAELAGLSDVIIYEFGNIEVTFLGKATPLEKLP